MDIVSHKHQDLATFFIGSIISTYSNARARSKEGVTGPTNYLAMTQRVDNATNNLALSVIRKIIEDVDMSFRNNPERLKKYHVKSFHKRTLMTIFGPLTFSRTFYADKHTKQSYSYTDDFFGFEKYGRFDMDVKSLLIEACSDMSMAAAGRKVSGMIGQRTGSGAKDTNISRQTVRTIVRRSMLPPLRCGRKGSTPETLFVMMDEKFVPLQREPQKRAMVHHAVIFEGMGPAQGHTKRNMLINRHAVASTSQDSLNDKVSDYICEAYDAGRIREIYVMGDGAGWIKASAKEYAAEGCLARFALDKYHFMNALRLIFLDKGKEKEALDALLANDRGAFESMCGRVLLERPDRSETIADKARYIRNNWAAARLSYRKNLRCCMEGQISHNIASLLASRPGAYSLKTLKSLLKIRMAFRNGADVKKLYLDSFSYSSRRACEGNYDFSVFDVFDRKETYTLGEASKISFLNDWYSQ